MRDLYAPPCPPLKKNCFLGYDGIWLWGSAMQQAMAGCVR
jgi:hypothetical protein